MNPKAGEVVQSAKPKTPLSFDDLDVTLFNPGQQHLEGIPDTLYLVHERLTTGILASIDRVTGIEMPVVGDGNSWELQQWEDMPIDGPMVKWAVTTVFFEHDRRPYDAELDVWLDED